MKVSLLLRENKQMDDGRFILFPDDKVELLSQANPPGTIRYYEDGRYSKTETFSLGTKSFEYIACTSKVSFHSVILSYCYFPVLKGELTALSITSNEW